MERRSGRIPLARRGVLRRSAGELLTSEEVMKIVINKCYGGFSISLEAAKHMAALGSERAQLDVANYEKELRDFAVYKSSRRLPEDIGKREAQFRSQMWDIAIKYDELPKYHGYGYVDGMDGGYQRDDPLLVVTVEALGPSASGKHSSLKVVEIPDGIEWEIDDYDGMESISEKHRTWG